MKKHVVVVVAMLVCMGWCACAQAAESTKFNVTLRPYRLGHETTLTMHFTVAGTAGQPPSALLHFVTRFPKSLEFAANGLGLAVCHPQGLITDGVRSCPRNSVIGEGRAGVELPVGNNLVGVDASLTALIGSQEGERISMALFAETVTPVSAYQLFDGELREQQGPSGEELLETNVPLMEAWPGSSDVLLTEATLQIDPPSLRYYQRVHGRRLLYHPRSFRLPQKCPRGGFHFTLSTLFADGSEVPADYTVPCPGR